MKRKQFLALAVAAGMMSTSLIIAPQNAFEPVSAEEANQLTDEELNQLKEKTAEALNKLKPVQKVYVPTENFIYNDQTLEYKNVTLSADDIEEITSVQNLDNNVVSVKGCVRYVAGTIIPDNCVSYSYINLLSDNAEGGSQRKNFYTTNRFEIAFNTDDLDQTPVSEDGNFVTAGQTAVPLLSPSIYYADKPEDQDILKTEIRFKSKQDNKMYTLPIGNFERVQLQAIISKSHDGEGELESVSYLINAEKRNFESQLKKITGHDVTLKVAESLKSSTVNQESATNPDQSPYIQFSLSYIPEIPEIDHPWQCSTAFGMQFDSILFEETGGNNGGNNNGGSTRPSSKPSNQPSKPEPEKPGMDSTPVESYRLYNPNTGEHFYTNNKAEHDMLVKAGWNTETRTWKLPTKSDYPIYRLYNPNSGDHHYTLNAGEKDALVGYGWKDEGVAMYSAGNDGQVIYRLYNPNEKVGQHFYTASKAEKDMLVKAGWNDEGTGFYGLK